MIAIPKQTFFNLPADKRQKIFDACIQEFSTSTYEDARLSNIINYSNIPRGSFYQYFEDKLDAYMYIFNEIGKEKITYFGDLFYNNNELSFLDLYKTLYLKGCEFALQKPKYVETMKLLYHSKTNIYDIVLKDGLNQAKEYYITYIEKDKNKGMINPNINSEILANLLIQTTQNITIDGINDDDRLFQYEQSIKKIEDILYILKKGIL